MPDAVSLAWTGLGHQGSDSLEEEKNRRRRNRLRWPQEQSHLRVSTAPLHHNSEVRDQDKIAVDYSL